MFDSLSSVGILLQHCADVNFRHVEYHGETHLIIDGNCLVQPERVAILVWQCIAPDYRQRGILGLYVGGASCPDAGAIPYRKWIFIA